MLAIQFACHRYLDRERVSLLLVFTSLVSLVFDIAPTWAQRRCDAKYLLTDSTTVAVKEFQYLTPSGPSGNILAIVAKTRQSIVISGHGKTKIQAVLSDGSEVAAEIPDLCSSSEIEIVKDFGQYKMVIR